MDANKNCIIAFMMTVSLLSCRSEKERSDTIELDAKGVYKVVVKKSDSTSIIVEFDKGEIKSVLSYKYNSLHGEQLKFKNERLVEKVETRNGASEGHEYLFYPSGALYLHNFFYNYKPYKYGVELWDECYEVMKKQIYYNDNGEVKRVRLFDSTGVHLRDSIL